MGELKISTLSIAAIAESISKAPKYIDDDGDYEWSICVSDDESGEVQRFCRSESLATIFDELGYKMDDYYKKYGVEDEDEDEDEEVDESWKEIMEERKCDAKVAMYDACADIEDLGNDFFRGVCADLLKQAVDFFLSV